jgi:hypothetical protein
MNLKDPDLTTFLRNYGIDAPDAAADLAELVARRVVPVLLERNKLRAELVSICERLIRSWEGVPANGMQGVVDAARAALAKAAPPPQ